RYRDGDATRLAPRVGVLNTAGAEVREALVPRLAATSNGYVRVRVEVAGTSPTTLRIKAWADGQPEPAEWQYAATDAQAIQGAGAVGLYGFLDWAATNGPLTASFDDLDVFDVAQA